MTYSGGNHTRQNELNYFNNCADRLFSGAFHVVTLLGESGIGKSWLADEISRMAAFTNAFKIKCTCFDANTPPQFLFDQIRHFALSLDKDEFDSFDYIESKDSKRRSINFSRDKANAQKSTYFDIFIDFLKRISEKRPILLIIDDLNWLDQDSIEFFLHCCRSFSSMNAYSDVPVLILCIADDRNLNQAASQAIRVVNRQPWCSDMNLGSLDAQDTKKLIAIKTQKRVSNSLSQLVRECTDGNPRLITEIVQGLVESSALSESGGYLVLRDINRLSEFQLFRDSYRNFETSRNPQDFEISDTLHKVLAPASLLGRRFCAFKLSCVLGLDIAELELLLNQSNEIKKTRGSDYEFRDRALWLSIIDRLDPNKLQKMHGEIAERLAKANISVDLADDWQILKHLLSAGPFGSSELSRTLGLRVGEKASAVYSWGIAAQGYEAAAAAEPSATDRGKLHMKAGTCYRYGWDSGPSIRQFLLAQVAFRDASDSAGMAEALVQEARQAIRKLSPGELTDLEPFQSALDLCGDDDALRCWTLTRLSDAYSHAHKTTKAIEHASDACALAEQIADDTLLNDALSFLGLAQMLDGDMAGACTSYENALACAKRADMKWIENIPQQRLTMAHLMSGDIASAARSNKTGIETASDTKYSGEACMAFAGRAMIESIRAQVSVCEESARETLRLFEQSRYPFGPYHALRALACIRCMVGDTQGALDALGSLVRPGHVFDEPKQRMSDLFSLMEVYITLQNQTVEQWPAVRREAARQIVLAYFEKYLSPKVTAYSLTECCFVSELIETLRINNITAYLISSIEEYHSKGVKFSIGWCFLVPRVLAQLYMYSGQFEQSISLLEESNEIARASDAPYELARGQFLLSRVKITSRNINETAQAHSLARHAAATFEDIGCRHWVERVATFCSDHGVNLKHYRQDHSETALADRTSKILEYIAKGSTTAQIAHELILSPGTVRSESDLVARKLYFEDGRKEVPVNLILMVTDIEQSTPMIADLGDRKARDLFYHHDQIVRNAVVNHGGVEIKNRGDGFLASFHSAPEALASARTVQRNLKLFSEQNLPWPVRVRIGLHSGELLLEDEGLFGLNIHVAVRVSEVCPPSRIVMSDPVFETAQNLRLPCSSLGSMKLKGLPSSLDIYEYMWWLDDVSS